jgi:hypothetical protein
VSRFWFTDTSFFSATDLVHLKLHNTPYYFGYILPKTISASCNSTCQCTLLASEKPPLSNHLDLTLTGRPDVHLHKHGLSSPLSSTSHSLGSGNVQRISWLESTPLPLLSPFLDIYLRVLIPLSSCPYPLFRQLILHTPRLTQFITRTPTLKPKGQTQARVLFSSGSGVRALVAVKNLLLSKEFAPRIAPSLQELVRKRVAETFPALESLFVENIHPSGPVKEGIEKSLAARRLGAKPGAILAHIFWIGMIPENTPLLYELRLTIADLIANKACLALRS